MKNYKSKKVQEVKKYKSIWTLLLFYFCTFILVSPAKATLFTYDFSVVMLAEYLAHPGIFGDITVGVFFPQDTSLDYPYNSYQLGELPRELGPAYTVNGYRNPVGQYWSLSEISLTDYRIWVGDPGGNVYMDLLYDQVQSDNAPFREPDRLLVQFGAETATLPGVCNTPTTGPCPIGTGGTHTFSQGEFSFERSHAELASIAEPNALLLTGAGLVAAAIQIKKRSRRKRDVNHPYPEE